MEISDQEFEALVKRTTTYDQQHINSLVGRRAVEYAQDHEADVRRLARHMWNVFPLGPRWWKINWALGDPLRRKNRAITARAEQIGRDRKAGHIVQNGNDLVDLRRYTPTETS